MIIRLDEIDSTNEYAKRFIADGWSSDDITTVSAQYQTAGKGRRGREWVSPPGTSLMFSMFFKPKAKMDSCPMITLVCALAVREALKEFDVETDIKWPNDIVINGRKVCGILTEALTEQGYIIVGAGVNMTQEEWPEELRDRAVSIMEATGDCVDEDALLERIIHHTERYLEEFYNTGDMSTLKEEYQEALVSMGREVKVLDPEQEYSGIALGINDKGELRVELADGSVREVYAGEVSVDGVYGYTKER